MDIITPARRVFLFGDIERAGDYYLTNVNWPERGGVIPEVFFLLPIHEGFGPFDRPSRGSGIHGVTSPPWTFRECPDGSLEIGGSIACGRQESGGEYWHGYLDEGNKWRQVLCNFILS